MYKITQSYIDKQTNQIIGGDAVIRMDDNVQIPFDLDNIDYQIYLEWLAEGNEPLPSDKLPESTLEERHTFDSLITPHLKKR
ncbi:MAG: hypothetical protein WDZ42_01225 [Candidatus Saccharimonadales bacterium]